MLIKLVENLQVTQPNQSEWIKVKSVQSFRGLCRTQLKMSAFVHWIAKKLHLRCSTRSSILTPLKLLLKIPEQHSRCSYAFIVGQILYFDSYAYLTCFRNSYFHFLEQVNAIWEGFKKGIRKCFGIKNVLQITTMIYE